MNVSGGRVEAEDGAALRLMGTSYISGGTIISANTTEADAGTYDSGLCPGTVWLSDCDYEDTKLYISGGTITNTATGCPAIFNILRSADPTSCSCEIYLSSAPAISGTPSISGSADIWTNTPIYASNGTVSYSGDALTLEYDSDRVTTGAIAVNSVTSGENDDLFSITNTGYHLALSGSALVISEGEEENSGGNGGGGSHHHSSNSSSSTNERTITVSEISSDVFDTKNKNVFSADANMENAFSQSVEVRVTDNGDEDSKMFSLIGENKKAYPFDISLYLKGTSTKTEPSDGYSVTITMPIPEFLMDSRDHLGLVHYTDGSIETIPTTLKQIDGVWCLVFSADDFSPYALVISEISGLQSVTGSGLPYYLGSAGQKMFIGFSTSERYIESTGKTINYAENPKSFTDISSHWAKDYIDFVTERELFNGTGENVFNPNGGMTRAMFATVIGRLYERSYGEIEKPGSDRSFTDVNYDSWCGPYVDWAAKNVIITGVGGDLFKPDRAITREEMAAILYRFAGFLGTAAANDSEVKLTYSDSSDISDWAADAAMYCKNAGIITGRNGGSFVPDGTASRAEVAVILDRFIKNFLN